MLFMKMPNMINVYCSKQCLVKSVTSGSPNVGLEFFGHSCHLLKFT